MLSRGLLQVQRYYGLWKKQENNPKMTHVNIATQMIIDAFQNNFDRVMLISGDSDLVPPIRAIHENFGEKRVFVAFPPRRQSSSGSTLFTCSDLRQSGGNSKTF
jgi:uncharacterized LabA/DUF88 family protein